MDFKEELQSYQKIVNDELQKYLRNENKEVRINFIGRSLIRAVVFSLRQ